MTRAPADGPPPPAHGPAIPVEDALRRVLLGLTAAGAIGTILELALLEHTEDALQWVPFAVCAVMLASVAAVWRRPGRRTILALRAVMALAVISSVVGAVLHLNGNRALVAETQPDVTGMAALWEAIHGGNPFLASGILGLMAVMAVAATYRHPALANRPDG